ncbi:hypothetical protein BJ165DRAFT_1409996 [Panaeolus papilionaceus]|nr:hypothetical protein BJ165DRAFT_1409996 [Panaeolus papilionaceus]
MNDAPFPIEIFGHILDDLAIDSDVTDSISALQACSLACKAFVPLSRRHLFRDINIGFYPHQEISVSRSRLIEILERYPAISSYIRGVTYTFHSTKEPEELKQAAQEFGNYLPYHGDDHSISLYELLPNAHMLCVTRGPSVLPQAPNYGPVYSGTKEAKWFSLYHSILQDFAGPRIQTVTALTICGFYVGLLDILNFPSLQSVVLVNVLWLRVESNNTRKTLFQLEPPSKIERITVEFGESFPVDILRFLPNLVHVDVGDLDLLSSDEVWPIFLNRDDYNRKIVVHENLQHVAIGDVCCFVPLCDAAESGNTSKCAFPALRSLKITLAYPRVIWMGLETDGMYTLLRHAPNLKKLEILGLNAWPPTLEPQLDHRIGRYGTSLEHLRLEYANTDNLAHAHSVLAIQDALTSLEGSNHLKTLELSVCAHIGEVQQWFKAFSGAWDTVDQMLGGHERPGFPYLKEFRVSLVICENCSRFSTSGFRFIFLEVPEIQEFDSEEMFWGLWAGCLTLLHSNSRVTRRFNPEFEFKYSSEKTQHYQLEFLHV